MTDSFGRFNYTVGDTVQPMLKVESKNTVIELYFLHAQRIILLTALNLPVVRQLGKIDHFLVTFALLVITSVILLVATEVVFILTFYLPTSSHCFHLPSPKILAVFVHCL